MPTHIQQFSDYGTSNPILARVFYQWTEIFKFHDLPKDRGQAVLSILHNEVVPRLVECERIAAAHYLDVEKGLATGVQPQGTAVGLPSVPQNVLKHRVENFLLNAQMALRDFSGVFAELLGKPVPKGNIGVVVEWAEKEFGTGDQFTKQLRTDHDGWITYLADMRIVIAHPDSGKGPFEIFNFTMSEDGKLLSPSWKLKGKERADIGLEMTAFNINLLTFCEEAVYYGLWHLPLKAPAEVVEIPEAERNPSNPIRFRMGFGSHQ